MRIEYPSRPPRRVHDGLHVGLLVSRLTERCSRLHTQVGCLSGVKRPEPVLAIAETKLYAFRHLGCEFRTQWAPCSRSRQDPTDKITSGTRDGVVKTGRQVQGRSLDRKLYLGYTGPKVDVSGPKAKIDCALRGLLISRSQGLKKSRCSSSRHRYYRLRPMNMVAALISDLCLHLDVFCSTIYAIFLHESQFM